MTDSEILDFCEEHDIEVSFRFEKEINGCHLRIRRGAWQYATIMVDKLDREQNARKVELEAHHDSD